MQEQPPPPKMWLNESHTSSNVVKSPKNSEEILKKSSTTIKQNKNADMKKIRNEKDMDEPTAELQRITKGLSMSMRTWENMTIDEVLKKAREVRYQPSPSISHLTEDSTVEPAHVIRDRLAAASRWYLNNKSQQNEPPQKQINYQKQFEYNDKNQSQNNNNNKKLNIPNASYQNSSYANNFGSDQNTTPSKIKRAEADSKNSYNNLKLRQANGENETALNGNKLSNDDKTSNVEVLKQRRTFMSKNLDKKTDATQPKIKSYNKKPNKVENNERFRKRMNVFEANNSSKNLLEKTYSKQTNEHLSHAPTSSRQLNSSTQRSGSYRRAVWSAPYLRSNENSFYKKKETNFSNQPSVNQPTVQKNPKTDSIMASSYDNTLPNKANKSQTDNLPGSAKKKDKWVNSYFKNKANYFQHRQSEADIANDNADLSEVPQLRTDIQARNSFLRKMQGKKKQRV